MLIANRDAYLQDFEKRAALLTYIVDPTRS
jgi:hypothetical protein